ncbi:hypothetical protein EB796_023363 [Bugula neritina]|uniref:KLHDC3 n=1 Tax=Bugula neritina TaxID=10212 RepID=A0A7J7IXR8_BUGNE|nr:hypothetical protein EB796_023363 [Bugula neritina]
MGIPQLVSEHVYTFDVVSRCWHRPKVTGTLPLARDGHSCCVVGNCMYLFGGFEEESMEFSNTVYSLNLTTFRWSFCLASGEEPIWRDFHSATAWRDYMIVFGGRSDEAGPIHSAQELYDDTIYMFDTRNNRWSVPKVTGPLPVGRRSHCAFEHKDRLYIFGGFNSNLGTHYNDIYMYNIKKKRWSPFKVGGGYHAFVEDLAVAKTVTAFIYSEAPVLTLLSPTCSH